jgi:acyl-CoA synthetase (NDP forming)
MLKTLLAPDSIVVIGGSDDLTKPGGRITSNILSKGYAGQLLIVNHKSRSIQGVPAYASIQELPIVPELALVAVPAQFVRQSLEDLAGLGTKAVVVLSSGFGELSEAGKLEEQCLAEFARQRGMFLLGPNCLGVMSPVHASKFAGIVPEMKAGGIDFISGSGATVDFLAEPAIRRGLSFASFLTVGNSAQNGVTDLLALFDQDHAPDSARIKILYLESINKPGEFLRAARSLVNKGCCLAGIKSGTTRAGSRAAASHTGAIATNDVAVQALLDKAGVIRVHSRLELIDVAAALTCAKGKLDGRRVCIISDAGGPGVMLADELNRAGFEVPVFGERTQARLAQVLPRGASVSNPVDCLPTRDGAMLSQAFGIINEEESGEIDYILFIGGDSKLVDIQDVFNSVSQAMDSLDIPVFPSFCAVGSSDALDPFRRAGKCFFEDEISMARALARVVGRPRISEPVEHLPGYDIEAIRALLKDQSGSLAPRVARGVLEAAGLRFPDQVDLFEKSALGSVPIPFPWVMKVIGPLHKTEVGGVQLGIQSLEEARSSWDHLVQIQDAAGCLVQEMVSGTEVLIGAKREEGFGHLVAFGLGGIYTEALKDLTFALARLSWEEAGRMIRSMRAFSLIQGVRGEPGLDIELLSDWLIRTSMLVADFPHIRELDLNPVKGSGSDLYLVDARVILD